MNRERFAEDLPGLVYRSRDSVDMPRLPEGLLWRDLLGETRGREIIEHATSPYALQRTALFEAQSVSLLRSLWLHLPRNSRMLNDLDVLMGFVIRQRILRELTVIHPVGPENPEIPAVPGKVDLDEWELFVLRHTKTSNHLIHLLSMLMFYVSPFLAWVFWNPFWLLPFFLSGLMGTFGHFITQDGGVSLREATSQHKVPLYVLRMFGLIVLGRYEEELNAVKRKLQ